MIAPLLFFSFEQLDKFHKSLKFLLITVIGVFSFAVQLYLTYDAAYMLLFCRLWQFMCGFGTFYLHESGLLNFDKLICVENKVKSQKSKLIF